MQDAGTVLEVLRGRGRKGLPCDELYRQMFNKDLYLLAYGNVYANQGAMTPGASRETADGMSEAKIGQIIELMRHERYRFAPVRRVYIPKKNGKLRPPGLPSWSGKLAGEVVRLLLEAYYEPQFSGRSHGFRKGRGCHTALREIQDTWTGTVWFIEGDISDCFGSIDHDILLGILAEEIHDQRFLRLIRNMLKAGYLEDWEYHDTLSGTPQGGVVTPPTQLAISASRSRWVTGGWSVAGDRRGAGGAGRAGGGAAAGVRAGGRAGGDPGGGAGRDRAGRLGPADPGVDGGL
jgi:retron-type reverse transcriptase